MGSHEFGLYVYVWTVVLVIGDLSDLGLPPPAQRFVPEYAKNGALDRLRGFLSGSRWIAVGSATVIAAIGITTVHLLQHIIADDLVLPLWIAFATLPFYTLMQMQDGIARAHNWVNIALLPTYVVRHLIMLAWCRPLTCSALPPTRKSAVIAVAAALLLTVIGQTIVLNRKLAREVPPGPKSHERKTWLSVSLPILMVEGFYLLLTNTDIVMLQHFRTPADVAVYYAAAKTLVLITFVHFAVSAAVGHRFSEYHVTNDRARLQQILSQSIRWTFWASLAASAVVLAMGPPLLSLFGPQFVDGYHLMLILAVGLLARASLGPVERLLNMVGEQRACAAVYAMAFVLNVAIGLVLIPRLGATAPPSQRRRRWSPNPCCCSSLPNAGSAFMSSSGAALRQPAMHAPLRQTFQVEWRTLSSLARSPTNGASLPRARSSPTYSTNRPLHSRQLRCLDRIPAPCWCGRNRKAGRPVSRAHPAGRLMVAGWVHPFAPLGVPLVDRTEPEAVIAAFLDHLDRDPAMPGHSCCRYCPSRARLPQRSMRCCPSDGRRSAKLQPPPSARCSHRAAAATLPRTRHVRRQAEGVAPPAPAAGGYRARHHHHRDQCSRSRRR